MRSTASFLRFLFAAAPLFVLCQAVQADPSQNAVYTPVVDDSNPLGIDTRFVRPVINDLGQVAMAGNFSRRSGDGNGVYVFDQFGLRKVVEEGDRFDGCTVTQVPLPTSYDPNAIFIGPSDVAFGVSMVDSLGTSYGGFYHSTGRQSVLPSRLMLETRGLDVIQSNDANENGTWATAFLQDNGTTAIWLGKLGTAPVYSPGPYPFTYKLHNYSLVSFDQVRANPVGGAFLKMSAHSSDVGANDVSGVLALGSTGVSRLFTDHFFQDNFVAGNNLVGGVSAVNGVNQMIVCNGSAVSVRDNGSLIFETQPNFRMNAIGQVSNFGQDNSTGQYDFVSSSSAGQNNLFQIANFAAPTGGFSINAYGALAAVQPDPSGNKSLYMYARCVENDASNPPGPVPKVLQVNQPFMGDTLFDFKFDGIRQFNHGNEAVVRYTLYNGQTGVAKVKLNVPIMFSFTPHIQPNNPAAVITFSGLNIDASTSLDVKDSAGFSNGLPLTPTSSPTVWTIQAPSWGPGISSLQVRLHNANSQYTTPWMTIDASG